MLLKNGVLSSQNTLFYFYDPLLVYTDCRFLQRRADLRHVSKKKVDRGVAAFTGMLRHLDQGYIQKSGGQARHKEKFQDAALRGLHQLW